METSNEKTTIAEKELLKFCVTLFHVWTDWKKAARQRKSAMTIECNSWPSVCVTKREKGGEDEEK